MLSVGIANVRVELCKHIIKNNLEDNRRRELITQN